MTSAARTAISRGLLALSVFYGGMVCIAGVLGNKQVALGPLAVEAGIFAFLLLVVTSSSVAELYGLPLEGFVPARNELARDLRKGGDKERAADVAKLKRPSVAAWTVNQLARSNRKELDLLLDAGHRLRTGQVEALEKGDPAKFEAARRDHERAVRDLVGAARELLASERGSSSDQMVASVERTLRYASIDEEQRPVLASGRLVEEVEATGFDAFAGMALPSAQAPAKGKTKKAAGGKREDATQRRKRVAAAQASLEQARERERGARELLREAERSERAAAKALDRATADVAAAREALEAASAEAREAADRLEAER
jgi:hypothetical protein